jgi:hypothetical protein
MVKSNGPRKSLNAIALRTFAAFWCHRKSIEPGNTTRSAMIVDPST